MQAMLESSGLNLQLSEVERSARGGGIFISVKNTVRLLSFRTDCAEPILCAPSGGHPQKNVGASLEMCA